MVSRREFIQGMCSTAVIAMASTLYPGMVFADARTDKRFVVVILRGGLDGLAALAPYGDPTYLSLRGDLALSRESLLRIDPFFGLHPSLEPLAKMYTDGDMIAVPATATPYRERSHFDAQNVLELGSSRPHGLDSGWLNRLVGAINARDDGLGLAFGQGLPTVMRGTNNVNSWAPSVMRDPDDDYMSLIRKVYAHDKAFASNFNRALNIQDMADDAAHGNERQMARQSRGAQGFVTMAETAGQWLSKPDGPRIATLELGGWDTHFQQGAEGGRLATNLSLFARGVEALRENMDPSTWSKTVVVALTEFGRTARPNGDRGTDHGTAATAFLFGGALNGGRVVHNWPGLKDADLYEGRDLRPTIDVRSVMKGVLHEHYGIAQAVLDTNVYPGSQDAKALRNLVKV